MKLRLLFAVLLSNLISSSATSPPPSGYRLVWAEEFEEDGPLDPEDWTFERGFIRNEELQWYQPENALCWDGYLIIEARKETKPNPLFDERSASWPSRRERITYTSASVTTKDRKTWKYGRFEIRARISVSDGLWPAIWFLGVDGEWPSCGEIDLMEYYGGQILANACWGTSERWQARWNTRKVPISSFADPDWHTQFHVWRMDWDAESIRLYLDDRLLNSIDLAHTKNPTKRGPSNPFHQPHYLLLNLAIGGENGGDPSSTEFPQVFEIDYVRVYQRSETR